MLALHCISLKTVFFKSYWRNSIYNKPYRTPNCQFPFSNSDFNYLKEKLLLLSFNRHMAFISISIWMTPEESSNLCSSVQSVFKAILTMLTPFRKGSWDVWVKNHVRRYLLALLPFLTISSLKSYSPLTNTFLRGSALIISALNDRLK